MGGGPGCRPQRLALRASARSGGASGGGFALRAVARGKRRRRGRAGKKGRRRPKGIRLSLPRRPAPDVALVLLAAKPDRRRHPWKRLSAEGELYSAEPRKGAALRAYVDAELRRRGLRLTPEAVAI